MYRNALVLVLGLVAWSAAACADFESPFEPVAPDAEREKLRVLVEQVKTRAERERVADSVRAIKIRLMEMEVPRDRRAVEAVSVEEEVWCGPDSTGGRDAGKE